MIEKDEKNFEVYEVNHKSIKADPSEHQQAVEEIAEMSDRIESTCLEGVKCAVDIEHQEFKPTEAAPFRVNMSRLICKSECPTISARSTQL